MAQIPEARIPHIISDFKADRTVLQFLCKNAEKWEMAERCGISYREAGEYEKAMIYFARSLERSDSEGFLSLANLGAIEHIQGNKEKAESYYLRALRLRPNDALIQKNVKILQKM